MTTTRLVAFAAAFICAVLSLGALGAQQQALGAEQGPPVLTLDGVVFRPELAVTPAARSVGLMFRRKAPADGMLFVFKHPTTTGFWMKNTLVPLVIVFFNAEGKSVRRLTMKPCRTEACPIYDPQRVYRFALELPVRDGRPARRLGPVRELRRLIRQSS